MTLRTALITALLSGSIVLPSFAQAPERFEALVGLARVKRDAGDLQASRRYFEQARQQTPFDPSLLAEYFWVLADLSPADALVVGQAVLTQWPDADAVRERSIAAAVASDNEVAVLALATAGVSREPGRAAWRRHAAASLARQGRAEEAVRAWQAAVAARDAALVDTAGLALALEAARDYQGAVTVWTDVPAADRQTHPEWERSRLRAVVQAWPPLAAAREADGWLAAHPDDVAMREVLVELWRRAGAFDRARATLQPLLTGPDRLSWMRRDVGLAQAAGQPAAAIARLEQMVSAGDATRADRLILIELLIETDQVSRVRNVLRSTATVDAGCDGAFLQLLDRIPGADGTSLLIDQLRGLDCRQSPDWIDRAIDRASAESRFEDALALVAMLPPARRETPERRRLAGQLHLWIGQAAVALQHLAPLVETNPADVVARDALVDAFRALGDPYAAWRVADPLLSDVATPAGRRLMFAELALEADDPEAVGTLLELVPAEATTAAVRDGLRGRALAARGRPAEVVRLLSPIPVSTLSASAVLALVDSVHATRGVEDALAIAQRADVMADDARDLLARRVMLETLASSRAEPTSSRAALDRADSNRTIFVDAEVALVQERPLDALALLATLPLDAAGQRAADLRVTALIGSGNLQAAVEGLQALRQQRARFTPFILREVELAWRIRPQAETLDAVLELPTRFPGNRHAAIAAARALAFEKRHAELIDTLGGVPARDELPVEGRVLMARSLAASGRDTEALTMLAGLNLRGSAAVFRAEVTARVDGAEAGSKAFEVLAQQPGASADTYLAWASIMPDAPARRAVLEQGAARFASNAALFSRLAVARAADGDREGSLLAAEQALAIDSDAGEAWFQLIVNTLAARPAGQLDAVLDRFATVAAARPALAITTADRAASLVRSAHDPLLTASIGWLQVEVDDPALRVSRDLALVRLYAAGQRWFEALVAADRAVRAHPEATAALRLRADVLSWAGRHADGIAAYDDYLAVAPADVDARRQQARVASWAGRAGDARRFYERLRVSHPDDAAITAEAEAKIAFLEGRWRDAVERYAHWLSVEPGNSEARFEMAEALRAAGDPERADAALSGLAPDGGHRLAGAARDREAWSREPSVAVVADLSSASGYDGQRLLDIRQSGARVHAVFGRSAATTLTGDMTAVHAVAGDTTRRGYQLGAAGGHRISRTAAFDGRVSVWDVSGPGRPVVQAGAGVAWSPLDRWTVSAGAGRELLLDTIATIDRRVTATGGFVGAAFESPSASLALHSQWQRLSDGNRRARLSLSATRTVSERLRQVRAIAWAEVLDYHRSADAYFAPAGFVRVDGGLEYTHMFSSPRFRGDRMDQLAVGYLIGTDSRGTLYQHPSARLAWEFSSLMAVSVRADVIRSRSYNEESLLVALHLIGGAFSR